MTTVDSNMFNIEVSENSGSSTLQTKAQGLGPGQQVSFDEGLMDNSISYLGNGDVFQWNPRFHRYSVNKQCWLVGKAPTPGPLRTVRFNELNDTWSVVGDGHFAGSGHPYDGHTIDGNGVLWWHNFGRRDEIHSWSGTDWTSQSFSPPISNFDGAWDNTRTTGLAWAPNLFGNGNSGFVLSGESGAQVLNQSNWTLSSLISYGTGQGKNSLCFYSEGHDQIFFSEGAASRKLYPVINGAVPSVNSSLDNTPTSIGVGSSFGQSNPIYGLGGVVYLIDSTNYYRLAGNSWVSAGTHSLPLATNYSWCICPVEEYGVFWYLDRNSSILWKP